MKLFFKFHKMLVSRLLSATARYVLIMLFVRCYKVQKIIWAFYLGSLSVSGTKEKKWAQLETRRQDYCMLLLYIIARNYHTSSWVPRSRRYQVVGRLQGHSLGGFFFFLLQIRWLNDQWAYIPGHNVRIKVLFTQAERHICKLKHRNQSTYATS